MKTEFTNSCKFCRTSFIASGSRSSWCSEICYFSDHCEPQPIEDKCRMWLGGRNNYGRTCFRYIYKGAHVMAYELFNGPIPKGHQIRHTCHNPYCVNPKHLLTGTSQDNSNDMVSAGRSFMCGKRDLSVEDVLKIFHSMNSIDEDAAIYKTERSNIQRIRAGETWKHITKNLTPPNRLINLSKKGVENPNVKLNENDVLEIYHSNSSYESLSSKYHVSESTIKNIKFGMGWKHLTHQLPIVNFRSKKSFRSNLSDAQLLEIYNSSKSNKKLAAEYHCDYSFICNIKNKKSTRICRILSQIETSESTYEYTVTD